VLVSCARPAVRVDFPLAHSHQGTPTQDVSMITTLVVGFIFNRSDPDEQNFINNSVFGRQILSPHHLDHIDDSDRSKNQFQLLLIH